MGKNRINFFFQETRKTAFIAYVTAGDPDYNSCLQVVDALVEGGVDILELGIPFSDPLADGEVNQLSAQRALDAGMTTQKCLELTGEIKKKYPDLPIVFYTYLNLVAYARDFEDFCSEASQKGVDALLILDLIPEESFEYRNIAEKSGLGLVALVAPTTKEERLKIIVDYASSFIYYVSREGVTGERNSFADNVDQKIAMIKKHTSLPVVVGFGISTPEHVKAAAETGVDGIVVGSAIVKQVQELKEKRKTVEEIKQFVGALTNVLN